MERYELEQSREYKAAMALEDALNNTCFDYKMFAESVKYYHPTLQQNLFRLIKEIINVQADENRYYDPRNKASHEVAKKLRGFKLGNPEHLMDKHEQAIQNSIRTIKEKAENNPNNKRAVAMLRTLTGKNATYQEMSDFLNEQGFTTSRGCSFSKSTVYKLIKRYGL